MRQAFKTARGQAEFYAAYDAAMQSWPVPHEVLDIPGAFGTTRVVISGPKDAPPLVLLHGYWATLLMWAPNVVALSRDYRVYAIDVMGQPSRTVPGEPIRTPSDLVDWLSATMGALSLDRATLIGMSYGGWIALNYAIANPERVERLVLLSPAASFSPLVMQFSLRGILMMLLPTRFTVNSFMRWLGFKGDDADPESARVGARIVDLMYLGIKHFRVNRDAGGVAPTVFSDNALRSVPVPTLLLLGAHEVIYDPVAALARARRIMPDIEAGLVPCASHDMSFRQARHVNARILAFLERTSRTALTAHNTKGNEVRV